MSTPEEKRQQREAAALEAVKAANFKVSALFAGSMDDVGGPGNWLGLLKEARAERLRAWGRYRPFVEDEILLMAIDDMHDCGAP